MSTTDDDRRTFDPRFDPAFQPGYDPRNDPTIAARGAGSRFSPDNNPAIAPEPLRPPDALEPSPRGRRRADDTPDEVEETDGSPDAAPPASGVNPFLIALWGLSLLLIVAGIVLLRSLPGMEQALQNDPDGTGSFFQLEAIGGITAALFGVGLAAAAGALAVHAAQWKGRPRSE